MEIEINDVGKMARTITFSFTLMYNDLGYNKHTVLGTKNYGQINKRKFNCNVHLNGNSLLAYLLHFFIWSFFVSQRFTLRCASGMPRQTQFTIFVSRALREREK